jgi:hypothetical protein
MIPFYDNMGSAIFRFMLLKRAYTQPEFEGLVAQTTFRCVRIERTLGTNVWLEKIP